MDEVLQNAGTPGTERSRRRSEVPGVAAGQEGEGASGERGRVVPDEGASVQKPSGESGAAELGDTLSPGPPSAGGPALSSPGKSIGHGPRLVKEDTARSRARGETL